MAEADAQLILLVGKLSQDMDEGIRQRSRLFRMNETVSHQLTELQAQFLAHAQHEAEARDAMLERMEGLAQVQAALLERVAVVEARPSADTAEDDKPASSGSKNIRLVGGLGGVGLLTFLFGEDLSGLHKVAEFFRRLF